MANTNAIVEKLKDVGLRHGEKLGVAIASGVFFLCIGLAAKKETINTDPEKIKAATKQSDANLNRPEGREKIVQNLEEKGIKDTHFAKIVDEQVKTALVPGDYKPQREWVSLEPGAGVIRDTPVLITVNELYAYPGRGGFLVYKLDDDGNRIPDDGKDQPKSESSRRRRKKRRAGGGGMMGGGGGMMGMQPKRKKSRSQADILAEQKAEDERKAKLLKGQLAGGDAADADAKAKEEAAEKEENFKEITKGHRWVVITGVFDHGQLVANYRTALKNPAIAHPNYKRLDLQRQSLLPDGKWSPWELLSADERFKVLENLPEIEDEELTPETVRPDGLVDVLPFLKAGLWEKVHVAKLVPKEKKEIAKTEIGGGMMGGGMMGGRGGGMMGGGDYSQMMQSMGGGGGANMMKMMQGGRRSAMGGGGMMGGGMMGGMGSSESAGAFWKSDEKKVMIRAFDFTAERDTTYRYRVRIVVFNPNQNRQDTAPGVNTTSNALQGPWSEATDVVQMPPDVMPYATGTEAASPKADMKVRFQVIRFRPDDGVTVTRNCFAGPGEVIGDPRLAEIPSSDVGGKTKNSTIDFNTHQIVLDVNTNKKTGGYQPLPSGFVGAPIDRPALTLLLRPDGSVMVHNEADDIANEVRRDVDANYKHELAQSGKERKNSMGRGMMGMMGGMSMGGMSGGMRGGGMGSGMR